MTNEEAEQRGHDAAMTMTDEALLPCPFCGSLLMTIDRISGQKYDVTCWECNSGQTISFGPESATEAEAITAWNRRAGQQSADERVKVLEAALSTIAGPPERDPDLPPIYQPRWSADQCRDIARAALAGGDA